MGTIVKEVIGFNLRTESAARVSLALDFFCYGTLHA